MDDNRSDTNATNQRPNLRIVEAEEVTSLAHKRPEGQRNRGHLISQLTSYCDQLDREIERILRL